MKKTGALSVFTDLSLPRNKIVIHPNDGFDLGLTNKSKSCALYLNTQEKGVVESNDYVPGSIILDNNCNLGTVNINAKIWKTLGKPQKAVLVCKGNSIFFVTTA
jgi:hypothetical protein